MSNHKELCSCDESIILRARVEELTTERHEHFALAARFKKERDAAIRALGVKGMKRGQAEARVAELEQEINRLRDTWEARDKDQYGAGFVDGQRSAADEIKRLRYEIDETYKHLWDVKRDRDAAKADRDRYKAERDEATAHVVDPKKLNKTTERPAPNIESGLYSYKPLSMDTGGTTAGTGGDRLNEFLIETDEKYGELLKKLAVAAESGALHTDPEQCRTWYDGCNCSPSTCNELWDLLDAAEAKLEARIEELRIWGERYAFLLTEDSYQEFTDVLAGEGGEE